MRTASAGLLVFFQSPIPGRVKTRLAADIGDDSAALLYQAMLRDLQRSLAEADFPILPYSPNGETFEEWSTAYTQRGSNLGARMFHAFQDCFKMGFSSLILVGSDIPNLNISLIKDALYHLKTDLMCIGATADGGYYLIGFQKKVFTRYLFRNICWSTSTVFADTVKKAQNRGISPYYCRPLHDVDTLADLHDVASGNLSANTELRLQLHRLKYIT